MNITPQVIKAIETAIQIEKDGLAFYTQAAQQVDDPTAKRMFQSLAKDEAAHLKLFEDVHERLGSEESWPSPEQVAAASPGEIGRLIPPSPSIFPSGNEIRKAEVPERQLAALKRGIQAEEDSIAFYSEQMSEVEDADGRAMYAYLVEQEKGHRTILQGEYDYLTNTGFWFDFREFDLEAPG